MLIPYQELSQEQKAIIRNVSRTTGHLFVQGPPGSGKTLISLYTIRDIIEERNIKILVLLYNHSLYGYLSAAISKLDISQGATIATKDSFFWRMRKSYGISVNSYDSYEVKYNHILSELQNKNLRTTYDVIIVDEVQDLNTKEMNLVRKIGKQIITLGDFDQGIYGTNLEVETLKKMGRFEELTKIYRFHIEIAKLANQFTDDDLVSQVEKANGILSTIIDTTSDRRFSEIREILKNLEEKRERTAVICPDRRLLQDLSDNLNRYDVHHIYCQDNKELRVHDFAKNTPLLLTSFSSKGLEFYNVIVFGFDKFSPIIKMLESEGTLDKIIFVSITRCNSNLYIVRTNQEVDSIKKLKVESNENEISIDDLSYLFN